MEDADDDFGDLYADVELQANRRLQVEPDGKPSKYTDSVARNVEGSIQNDDDEGKGASFGEANNDSKVGLEANGDSEVGLEANGDSKVGLEANGDSEVGLDYGSDSEDDFNIVLNDDDDNGNGFALSRGVNSIAVGPDDDENENGCFEVVAGGGDMGDGLEKNIDGIGKKGIVVKVNYQSQYKYMRPHTDPDSTYSKANGSVGLKSYNATIGRVNRGDEECSRRIASSSFVGQSGHNFSLPWHRTIFDVSIDAFEQKPWTHPGADLTDFFNFGFNEESWKIHCNHLEQLRQQLSSRTRISGSEFSKPVQAYGSGAEYEAGVHGPDRTARPASKTACRETKHFEMPKGMMIQVEDSILERRPSMDVWHGWRSDDRDSDVVIQIAVQDTLEEHDSGKEESVRQTRCSDETSNTGDFGSIEEGEESIQECLEPTVDRSSSPVTKRCSQPTTPSNPISVDSDNHGSGQLSGVDEHERKRVTVSSSEGDADILEISNNIKEKVSVDNCDTDVSMGETESLLGEQTHHDWNSAYSENDFIASGHGGSAAYQEGFHDRSRRSKSISKLQDSVASDHYVSNDRKGYSNRTKFRDCKPYARKRSPTPQDLQHRSKRPRIVSEKRMHHYNDDAPLSSATDRIDGTCYSAVERGRRHKRLHSLKSYGREDVSHFGKRYSYDQVDVAYSKKSRRSCQSFQDNADWHPSRKWDAGEIFRERRVSREDEVMERDRYRHERELSSSPLHYKGSRRLVSDYSCYLDNERSTRWRKDRESKFRKDIEDEILFDRKYQDDMIEERYRRADEDGKYFNRPYERHLPNWRGDENNCRIEREYDRPSVDLDDVWPMSNEEEDYWRSTDPELLSNWSYRESHDAYRGNRLNNEHGLRFPTRNGRERRLRREESSRNREAFSDWTCRETLDAYRGLDTWHGSRLTEVHGRGGRMIREGRSRNGDWFSSNHSAGDTEGDITYSDSQVHIRRRQCQLESFHWTEDEYISRYEDDGLLPRKESCYFEENLQHRRFDSKWKLNEDQKVEQLRKGLNRGNSSNCIERSSDIIHRGNHDTAFLRSRDLGDSRLIVREGKLSRRGSDAKSRIRNNKPSSIGLLTEKKQVSADYEDSCAMKKVEVDEKNAVKPERNDEKWLDESVAAPQNEALDIEEGQIITEAHDNLVNHDLASVKVEEINHEKTRSSLDENAARGKKVENPRILEMIAKMEKRRQRFQEAVSITKEEAVEIPKLEGEIVAERVDEKPETGRQQRPVRKRRWGRS